MKAATTQKMNFAICQSVKVSHSNIGEVCHSYK